MLTGGGTGGHITPLLAVAEQLKAHDPTCHIVYVGERGGKFAHLTQAAELFDEVHTVYAGKFRRYHGEAWWQKLLDVRTLFYNLRDTLYVGLGTIQSLWLLRRLRPEAIFLKGGYVGVPVGISGAVFGIPMMTHDSDAIPGLANRLVGRWARLHAVASPAASYHYPQDKTVHVGVLVERAYRHVTPALQRTYKREIDAPKDSTVLLVTGGSSGAVAINKAIYTCVPRLLDAFPDLYVVHQVGKGKAGVYNNYTHKRLRVLEFLRPMSAYMGAADVVVTRGSANTIAELAVQGKPTVVVPSPYLANGHQLKNAAILQEQGSAWVVQEADLYDAQEGLEPVLTELLSNPSRRKALAGTLHVTAPDNAAQRVAELLRELAMAEGVS